MYHYQLAKFGDFMRCGSKEYSKMYLVSCTNTHLDVTIMVNHGMVKNKKTGISWERNIIFLQNKEILNLCLRWQILRSYCFVAEVTIKSYMRYQVDFLIPLKLQKIYYFGLCRKIILANQFAGFVTFDVCDLLIVIPGVHCFIVLVSIDFKLACIQNKLN